MKVWLIEYFDPTAAPVDRRWAPMWSHYGYRAAGSKDGCEDKRRSVPARTGFAVFLK